MTKTKADQTTAIAADICLYGNGDTGAGWLARTADGLMFGTGEPRQGVSFTEAVWAAAGGLQAHGLSRGTVRVFAPGGERMATIELDRRVPIFGDLRWQPAPVYTIAIPTELTPATEAHFDDQRARGRREAKARGETRAQQAMRRLRESMNRGR